jgi:hypothetical protein
MFTAVLDPIAIAGKTISADALLTQRKLAVYLVERQAHYHFTVKGKQRTQCMTTTADQCFLIAHRRKSSDPSIRPAASFTVSYGKANRHSTRSCQRSPVPSAAFVLGRLPHAFWH